MKVLKHVNIKKLLAYEMLEPVCDLFKIYRPLEGVASRIEAAARRVDPRPHILPR